MGSLPPIFEIRCLGMDLQWNKKSGCPHVQTRKICQKTPFSRAIYGKLFFDFRNGFNDLKLWQNVHSLGSFFEWNLLDITVPFYARTRYAWCNVCSQATAKKNLAVQWLIPVLPQFQLLLDYNQKYHLLKNILASRWKLIRTITTSCEGQLCLCTACTQGYKQGRLWVSGVLNKLVSLPSMNQASVFYYVFRG